jgi:uncharacterized phage protein gp47/JayE
MAWTTPDLKQIITNLTRSAATEMPGADAALARNNLRPVAKIFAGGLDGLYRYADWIFRQIFVASADGEILDRHGAEMKPPVPRKLASAAGGHLAFTSTALHYIEPGAIFVRADGVRYKIVDGGTISDAAVTFLEVVAEGLGEEGNALPDVVLTPVIARPGVSLIAVSEAGLTGGDSIEDDAAYRRRLLFAKSFPDHAGALPDYVRYATAVAGCTRCFVATGLLGRSTVTLYPLFEKTSPSGLPLPSDLLRVREKVAEHQPGAARVYVVAATAYPVNVTVSGLSPNTPAVRRAVEEELAALFRRNARVSGAMNAHPSMPFLATPAVMRRSWLGEAVSIAAGEEYHAITVPAADVVVPAGAMAVLGSVTFV